MKYTIQELRNGDLISLRVCCGHLKSKKADVAQLVEQPIRNRQVSGSSPLVGSILSIT
jgi:hypothetical protein